jgi:hypothetical protein
MRTVATRANTAVELGNDQPPPTQRLTLAIRLADGGAEQVPDAAGESQAERSAGDEPQDSSADAASAQAGCSTSCLASSGEMPPWPTMIPGAQGSHGNPHPSSFSSSRRLRRCAGRASSSRAV